MERQIDKYSMVAEKCKIYWKAKILTELQK